MDICKSRIPKESGQGFKIEVYRRLIVTDFVGWFFGLIDFHNPTETLEGYEALYIVGMFRS
ncbi:hypothetical protein HI914_06402 [Erysiphe necator]|nr:hypothetical protein HI914_06402 [Erysiphe necator]